MNLKDAHKLGKLKEFAKEHEIKDPHPLGEERFDGLMDAMARGRKLRKDSISRNINRCLP